MVVSEERFLWVRSAFCGLKYFSILLTGSSDSLLYLYFSKPLLLNILL